MTYQVGDRVSFNPDFAHLFDDCAWGEKLLKPRGGTIVKLPWFIQNLGKGTLLVDWDSLTGPKKNPDDWLLWVHSNWLNEVDA